MSTIRTPKWADLTPISALVPYERNSRTHSPQQVAQIAASMIEFGFTAPVLADERGNVLAGHGRLEAAKSLGMEAVPVVRVEGLTDAQRRAYVLADNKIALNAGWDDGLLLREIRELEAEDFNVDLTGFSSAEIDALVASVLTPNGADEDAEEKTPDLPKVAVTKPGDVWLLGKHRVMCGDSTSIDAVDALLSGRIADMVNTDPPYGVSYQSNMRTKSAKFDVLQNDDKFLDIVPIIESCSKGWVFIWTSWKVIDKWLANTKGLGFPTNIVIWSKGGGGIGDLKKTFSTDYEMALVFNRGSELCGKRIGSVWRVGKDGATEYAHPTQKPVALAEEAIDKTTKRGALVLDLFGGSGSTLIACEKTSRVGRLMELDPRYCDVIVQRWEEFAGGKAKLEVRG